MDLFSDPDTSTFTQGDSQATTVYSSNNTQDVSSESNNYIETQKDNSSDDQSDAIGVVFNTQDDKQPVNLNNESDESDDSMYDPEYVPSPTSDETSDSDADASDEDNKMEEDFPEGDDTPLPPSTNGNSSSQQLEDSLQKIIDGNGSTAQQPRPSALSDSIHNTEDQEPNTQAVDKSSDKKSNGNGSRKRYSKKHHESTSSSAKLATSPDWASNLQKDKKKREDEAKLNYLINESLSLIDEELRPRMKFQLQDLKRVYPTSTLLQLLDQFDTSKNSKRYEVFPKDPNVQLSMEEIEQALRDSFHSLSNSTKQTFEQLVHQQQQSKAFLSQHFSEEATSQLSTAAQIEAVKSAIAKLHSELAKNTLLNALHNHMAASSLQFFEVIGNKVHFPNSEILEQRLSSLSKDLKNMGYLKNIQATKVSKQCES